MPASYKGQQVLCCSMYAGTWMEPFQSLFAQHLHDDDEDDGYFSPGSLLFIECSSRAPPS